MASSNPGYSLLASLMGTHPELAIFHRFPTLNSLNLLYQQAELKVLEDELQQLTRANASSKVGDRSKYDRDWEYLSESATAENGDPRQWQTMQKIKAKLNEYNKTLFFYHMVAKIGQPNERDLDFLNTWMRIPTMGNVYLIGPDSEIWRGSPVDELLCILPRPYTGWLTHVITVHAVSWYHRVIGHYFRKPDALPFHRETVYYSHEKLARRLGRITAVIGMVLASTLPVASIVVLYWISNMTIRLIAIGSLTAVFSLGLGLFTNGKMVDIFSATAAFAAVQVVFVGGSNQAPSS